MDQETAAGGDTTDNVDQQLEQMRQEETHEPEVVSESADTAGDAGNEPQKTQEQKQVPLAALHEERARRKEMQQRLDQMEMARQRDMQVLNERLQQLINPAKQLPPVQEDPIGNFDARLSEVTQTNQQLLQTIQQERQQRAQVEHIQTLAQGLKAREEQFVAQNPDYQSAIDHMTSMRVRELQAMGASEEQAVNREYQERAQAALTWANNGMNPAEVAYNLAKARGFQPKPTASQKIETQQRGMAASRSLGSGGGVSNALTAESILKMTDAEFDKLTTADFKKAMGG